MSSTSGEGGSSTEHDRSRGRVDPSGHTTHDPSPTFPTTSLHTPSPPTRVSDCCGCCWICGGEEAGVGWMDSSANPRSRFRLSNFRTRFVALSFELESWFGGETCSTPYAFVSIPPYTIPPTPTPPLLPSGPRSSGCFRLRFCENHGWRIAMREYGALDAWRVVCGVYAFYP